MVRWSQKTNLGLFGKQRYPYNDSPNRDKGQIIILDDNLHPYGRATQLQDSLQKCGFNVRLFTRFDELKSELESRRIDPKAMFVLDSTLEDERLTFENTLPYLAERISRKELLLPASADYENNLYFRQFFERRGISDLPQPTVTVSTFNFRPHFAAGQIMNWYKQVYPNDETVRELRARREGSRSGPEES